MADNNPTTPAGAVPPKPGEAAKVQPKKETVRINLPPKPTAAPTVRLPSPPAAGVAAPAAATAAPAAGATVAPAAPSGGTPAAAVRPVAAAAPAPVVSTAPRPAGGGSSVVAGRVPLGAEVSVLDKVLAIAAAVLGLGVLGHLVMLSLG